jgi:hypothetical protein
MPDAKARAKIVRNGVPIKDANNKGKQPYNLNEVLGLRNES